MELVKKYREFYSVESLPINAHGAVSIPAVKTQCGYACSDHASFGKAGYQSAFAYVPSMLHKPSGNLAEL